MLFSTHAGVDISRKRRATIWRCLGCLSYKHTILPSTENVAIMALPFLSSAAVAAAGFLMVLPVSHARASAGVFKVLPILAMLRRLASKNDRTHCPKKSVGCLQGRAEISPTRIRKYPFGCLEGRAGILPTRASETVLLDASKVPQKYYL